MQLWCTMKTGANITGTKFQHICSLLLILLFMFVAVSPLLHHHKHSHAEAEVSANQKETVHFTDECAVCDYYHHIQGQQILLYHPPLETILNTVVITLDNRVLISNYKFTLQGFTNKGPPTPIS